jgi:hypothetical protein
MTGVYAYIQYPGYTGQISVLAILPCAHVLQERMPNLQTLGIDYFITSSHRTRSLLRDPSNT